MIGNKLTKMSKSQEFRIYPQTYQNDTFSNQNRKINLFIKVY